LKTNGREQKQQGAHKQEKVFHKTPGTTNVENRDLKYDFHILTTLIVIIYLKHEDRNI